MGRKKELPLRVAAILVWIPTNGIVPLIATHVPAKADPVTDYTITTLTGHCDSRFEYTAAISAAIEKQLRAYPENVTRLRYRAVSKDKDYQWYLAVCRSEQRFEPDPKEVLQICWNLPGTLAVTVSNMSEGRRLMFLAALNEAMQRQPELFTPYEKTVAFLCQQYLPKAKAA